MDHFFNKKMETRPRKIIEELQLKRLKQTVKTIYETVPFYRQKFKELKITSNDIKTLKDIEKLPFTTKNDLRINAPFDMVATPLEKCIELVLFTLGGHQGDLIEFLWLIEPLYALDHHPVPDTTALYIDVRR